MYLSEVLGSRQEGGAGANNGPQASTTTLSVNPTAVASSAASASATSTGNGNSHKTILIVVIVIVAVLVLISIAVLLHRTRVKHKNPKYIPTPFLKRLWTKWDPSPMNYRLPAQSEHLEPISSRGGRTSDPPSSFPVNAADTGTGTATAGATADVNRNTSVRSVMTLPPYHPSALQNEQVIGREGERGGIDVVIEFPETVDEEEEQRENEMEALYQVRLARRRENEEREERRRLRREARERGDYVALREIAARARAASGASAGRTVEELRAEHDRIKKERQRAVSSVQYADLGVARHDGTRLRANSNDSERQGLLGDAASIGASSRHHRRDRSASSVLSIDTMGSGMPSPGLTRSRANSRPESPGHELGSSPEMIEHSDIPPNSPPEYENISLNTPHDERSNPIEPPPDYSSPVVGRGEHPMFENVAYSSRSDSSANRNRTSPSPPLSGSVSPPNPSTRTVSPPISARGPISPPAHTFTFPRDTASPPPNDYHPSPLRRQASISERREYDPPSDSSIPHRHPSISISLAQSDSRSSSPHGRRASNPHVGQLISERRTSNQSPLSGHRNVVAAVHSGSNSISIINVGPAHTTAHTSSTPPPTERRHSGRGVGGVPQLPSLRLGALPRIEVDPGSPMVGKGNGAVTPIAELGDGEEYTMQASIRNVRAELE